MKNRIYVWYTDALFLLTALLGWQQHVFYKESYQNIFLQRKELLIIPRDIGLMVFIVSTAGFIILTAHYMLQKDKEEQEKLKRKTDYSHTESK